MATLPKTEIHLSKRKLAKLLIFSILFLSGGLWMIITNPQTSNPLFNNIVMKSIASYGGVLMGSLGIFFFTRKLFDTKPGLVIDEKGIDDNTTAFRFGLIPWSDIVAIHSTTTEVSFSKQHFITLALKDPDRYIQRESNTLKRKLLSANASRYGSPVHISTNGLNISHDALLTCLTEYAGHYLQPHAASPPASTV